MTFVPSVPMSVCVVDAPGMYASPLVSFKITSPSGVFDDQVQGDQCVTEVVAEPAPPNGKIIPIGDLIYPALLIGSPPPWWWLVVKPNFPEWGISDGSGYGVLRPRVGGEEDDGQPLGG